MPIDLLPAAPCRWALHEGDCVRMLADAPDAWADLVLTDPPYGISYASQRAKDFAGGRSVAHDDAPMIWFLRDAARALASPGALICFCRWDVQEVFRVAIRAAGLDLRGQAVWDRGVHGAGDAACTFAPRHDVMWFATKGPFVFPGRRPKSIIHAMRPHHTAATHPTEKPVGLLTTLVEALTPADGLVLDCFAGSASTGEAALISGRRFVGIELDGRYVEAGRRRLAGAAPLFLGREHADLG